MDADPTSRNRLGEAASPYLRDHADNPVNWQPWDETALAAARAADRPIFLSIGYAACHWCHVMADESFSDDAVATALNRSTVPIKVDREERPDLDRFYQTAGRITGGGGWPLSAWLTPDGRPFKLATYLPPRPKRGLPGLIEVLESVETAWEHDRSTIEARADELTEAVKSTGPATNQHGAEVDHDGVLTAVADDVVRLVDHAHGGFQSNGPKFPQASRLEVLLRASRVDGRDAYRHGLVTSLDAMATAGLCDHVGHGFFRYVTDPQWAVPHFEKMAYDNALLLGLFAEAGWVLDEQRYVSAAHDAARFLADDLRHDAGGICCSLDADTEGEEGATYVWTAEQAHAAIDDEHTAELVVEHLGLDGPTEVGDGRVPRIAREASALAAAFDQPLDEVNRRLTDGLAALADRRRQRPQPRRDDKVIAAWNGLAVRGFARAGVFLDEPAYLETAGDILTAVDETMRIDGRLHRRYRGGDTGIEAFLDDYGAVAAGAFELASATGDEWARSVGLELVEELLERLWDGPDGGLRYAPGSIAGAPADPLDPTDRSMPSAVALAVDALSTATGYREDEHLAEAVDWILEGVAGDLADGGVTQSALALAVDRVRSGPPSITVAGTSPSASQRRRLCRHPRRPTVVHRPASVSADTDVPLYRDRSPVGDGMTLYPCRGHTCGPPTDSVGDALAWLDGDPA